MIQYVLFRNKLVTCIDVYETTKPTQLISVYLYGTYSINNIVNCIKYRRFWERAKAVLKANSQFTLFTVTRNFGEVSYNDVRTR